MMTPIEFYLMVYEELKGYMQKSNAAKTAAEVVAMMPTYSFDLHKEEGG